MRNEWQGAAIVLAYEKDPPKRVFRFRMVRARGLEPPWGCPHTDLNRTRLPIPPRPRIGALTRQEGMLRHFPGPRKSEFPKTSCTLLRNGKASFTEPDCGTSIQDAKRDAKHSSRCAKQGSRLSVKTSMNSGAFKSGRKPKSLTFSHGADGEQHISQDTKRPAEAGLSISNGAGERT